MSHDGPVQQDLPYTKVPNIFLDEWVNSLGLVEIRIVAAIMRRTFGWHRSTSGPLSISELSMITKRSRPLVVKALARLMEYGIVDRSRLSRQESFGYGLIMRAEFNELREVPPPAKQKALPYDVLEFQTAILEECKNFSGKENLTTEKISVVKKPLPLSGKENLTTEPTVLISVKERRSKETHTHGAPVENIAARQRVCGSRFDRKTIRAYAWASHNFTAGCNAYWEARGQKHNLIMGIRNPNGWANAAHKTGEHDDEIQEWLDDPGRFDLERFRRKENASYH